MAGLGGSYTPARSDAQAALDASPAAPAVGGPVSSVPQGASGGGEFGVSGGRNMNGYVPGGGLAGTASPTQANSGQTAKFNMAVQAHAKGGVVPGEQAQNAVLRQEQMGPDPAQLEEQRRRQAAAAQMNTQDPNNSALAGYMMG